MHFTVISKGWFPSVCILRAVGNLIKALPPSSSDLNKWPSLFPLLSSEDNGTHLTKNCGDSMNEISHVNTATDTQTPQDANDQYHWPYYGGAEYKPAGPSLLCSAWDVQDGGLRGKTLSLTVKFIRTLGTTLKSFSSRPRSAATFQRLRNQLHSLKPFEHMQVPF